MATMTAEIPTGVIPRPPFQLRSLPIPLRWEVTRRHPYYQHWWQLADDFYEDRPVRQPAEEHLRAAALVVLRAIGVTGQPVDPARDDLDFDQLDEGWLTGAVQPMSMRGMAMFLLATLPPDDLERLARCFEIGSRHRVGDDEAGHGLQAMTELHGLTSESLDSYLDEPIVTINPAASQQQVLAAIRALHAQWREERDLGDRRLQADRVPDYLKVRDRREGWGEGRYGIGQATGIMAISEEFGRPRSTVWDHSRRAFELIIGHPYTPELWWHVMGAPLAVDCGIPALPRPTRSRANQPVTETTVGVPLEVAAEGDGNESEGVESAEFRDQLRFVLGRHDDDAEVLRALSLPADDEQLLGCVRRFREEFAE